MGTYTDFRLSHCKLKDPDYMEAILAGKFEDCVTHPFFKTPRHKALLQSCYISNRDDGRYDISCLANIKNYDNEIELFIDWLTPYLDEEIGVCLGFKLSEYNLKPTLLYHPNKWVIPACDPNYF